MKISNISVDRPVAITMIILTIILLGIISFNRLPMRQMPKTDSSFLMIRTTYRGASPEEIEDSVTKIIEENVATLNSLDTISSTSYEGYSMVKLEMEYGTDLTETKNDLRDIISRMSSILPNEADAPQIITYDPNSEAILTLAISGEDLVNLKNIAEDEFKPALEKIVGVASVEISGGLERELHVNVNQDQMLGYGLNLNNIASSIKAATSNATVGNIKKGYKKISLRAVGDFNSIDEIRNISIITQSGKKIPLSEVATVEDTFADRDSFSYLNGKNSLTLLVQKEGDSNTVQVAKEALSVLDTLKKENPNIDISIISNSADDIENSISNVAKSFMVGGLLAIIILFLFLRNVRTTIIIATAIPTSVIATFVLMYFGNLTLNILSLGGLTLGVGMLLDNSIVVLENIYRHYIAGDDRIKAAKEGSAEVATAIIASTMTTAAVFLPIIFVKDMLAQLFTPFSLTVTFSLLASLFVALTFVPMLSSKLLNSNGKMEEAELESNDTGKFGTIKKIYIKILSWSLEHNKTVVAILLIGLILFGTGLGMGLIPLKMEYIPSSDLGKISVYIDLAQNTMVERTAVVLKDAENRLKDIPEIETINSSAENNSAELSLKLIDLNKRERSVDQVAEEVRTRMKGIAADIYVAAHNSMMGSTGKGGNDIKINIQGPNLEVLSKLSDIIVEQVKSIDGTRNIAKSLDDNKSEFKIYPKIEIANELGFTTAGITSAVDDAVEGNTVSTYSEDGKEYDINLKISKDQIENIDELKQLMISSATGITVPLEQVANIEEGTGYNKIEREDQERVSSISLGIYDRALNEVQQDIEEKINNLSIPAGYTVTYGGNVDNMNSSFNQLAITMILSIILVYMVMAAQFESLIHPFIVMFSVPLSLVGAVLGLSITGIPLSVPGFIGVIMLVGIVVNNAIVIIDYINSRRRTKSKKEAIIEAGETRIRPIMMTTLTTVLAMVPMSLGIGQGAEQQQPMAIVVMAGLLFSTILTLVVIPVLYDIVDEIKNKFHHIEESIG
jgi:HAE1 family hydrophobic/amphiphilic exporter-1